MNWLPIAIVKYFTGATTDSIIQPTGSKATFGGAIFLVSTILIILFSSIILTKWQ